MDNSHNLTSDLNSNTAPLEPIDQPNPYPHSQPSSFTPETYEPTPLNPIYSEPLQPSDNVDFPQPTTTDPLSPQQTPSSGSFRRIIIILLIIIIISALAAIGYILLSRESNSANQENQTVLPTPKTLATPSPFPSASPKTTNSLATTSAQISTTSANTSSKFSQTSQSSTSPSPYPTTKEANLPLAGSETQAYLLLSVGSLIIIMGLIGLVAI